MKQLIVNADDFGMAESVDLGIVQGHREGIITSASLLAGGESSEHAASLARENPELGVGIHLCLSLMRPVLDPSEIPTITKDGNLLPGPLAVMSRLTFGLIDKREVKAELTAQVKRAIGLGIHPTHLDGHQHLHVMPGIFPVVAEVAREFGIRAMRFPVGPATGNIGHAQALEKFFLEALAKSQLGTLSSSGMKCPERFYGLAQTGSLDADSVMQVIETLPDGTSELMCHPGLRDDAAVQRLGWGEGWAGELSAVTDARVVSLVKERDVRLISYKDL